MLAPCLFLSIFFHLIYAKMESFVVGGQYAEIEKYPHSAFLIIKFTDANGKNITAGCGSSILNQNIVLTAAHCFRGNTYDSINRMLVNVGNKHKRNGTKIIANGFIIHELYNDRELSNDIAVVRLSSPLKFSSKVGRVAIMHKPPHEQAMVAGWGLVNEELIEKGNLLKELNQKIISNTICSEKLGGLPAGTICAKSNNSNEYFAPGDSGSALVVRGYIQVGLLSYKVPTQVKHIMVYTDVGYFFDWISENAYKLSCDFKTASPKSNISSKPLW